MKNTGNVVLSGVTVTEQAANFSGTGTLPVPVFVSASGSSTASVLMPGDSANYSAFYLLTAADIAARQVDNQALASGTPPVGPPVTDDSDSDNPSDPNETGDPGSETEDDPTGTPNANYSHRGDR